MQAAELEGMPGCPAKQKGQKSALPLNPAPPLQQAPFKLCPGALRLQSSSPSGLMAVTHLRSFVPVSQLKIPMRAIPTVTCHPQDILRNTPEVKEKRDARGFP